MIQPTCGQRRSTAQQQRKGADAQGIPALVPGQQKAGGQIGPIQQLQVFPQALLHGRKAGGDGVWKQRVDKVETGSGQRSDHKQQQRRFGQTGHDDTPSFLLIWRVCLSARE